VIRGATLGVALALLTGCAEQGTAGPAVFHRACSGCHTLTGHDTTSSGGDLGANRLTVRQLESFVAVMPVRPKLTRGQTRAVAAYVASR
jgi:mono/diheme cytochrome c family protein